MPQLNEEADSILADHLIATRSFERFPFHMPGHKGGRGAPPDGIALFGADAYRADLSEMGGFDYLHGAESAMRVAQSRAAALFGATRSWFLVNGATAGNLAALWALLRDGDGLLLARNSHRSVYAGIELSGARPFYLSPVRDRGVDGFFGIDPSEVDAHLQASPEIRAVHVTSPSYYGFTVDLAAVLAICRRHAVPLVVDEAHGTHFRFHPSFPRAALDVGADVVVQSPHKTLGSLTQSSLLHGQGGLVDFDRIDAMLQMLQSSSPSALLTVSLDLALQQMARHGNALWSCALELGRQARQQLRGIEGLLVYGDKSTLPRGVEGLDLTKLVVDVGPLGLSAPTGAAWLRDRCGLFPEFTDLRRLVFLLTYADDEESVALLTSSIAQMCGAASRDDAGEVLSSLWPEEVPTMASTPRSAGAQPSTMVGLDVAVGRVCAEMIVPYPPGIPLVVPGEVLSDSVLAALRQLRGVGCRFVGIADESGTAVRCLA